MLSVGVILFVLTLTAVSMQFVNHWYLSKGKLHVTYRLTIAILVLYMIIETTIALRDPEQYSLLLCDVINAWGIIMSLRGIRRLNSEKKETKNV